MYNREISRLNHIQSYNKKILKSIKDIKTTGQKNESITKIHAHRRDQNYNLLFQNELNDHKTMI